MEYLVTFHTHFDAIQYIKFLKEKGINAKLRPVPRKISSSCGTCVVFSLEKAMTDVNAFIFEGFSEIFLLTDKINIIYSER